MATLTLAGINKRYPNGAHAVRGVNMEIADGEFVVLVGPSGCGKSTLLRMVAGLESITDGEISIDGERINDASPSDRDVAMVFQNYALYPHMTVFKNLAYGLINRGMAKDDVAQKVRETAKLLDIEDFLDRKPAQLSGGQRQRVAMGRAIVRNPKIFLFDEPLSNLDAKLRVQMRIEIRRLQRKLGVTCLYVTHDQVEAMTLGDRLAVINDGKVEQVGSPIDLYNDPKTLFVASFIGSPQINLLPGKSENGQLRVGDMLLPGFDGLPADQALILGVRPEHLTQQEDGPFRVTIELVERLGADCLVYGSLGESAPPDTSDLCLRTKDEIGYAVGDRLTLAFDPRLAMVFHKDSGERII
jgi:sn-glycerol 3-phosphate transport system ATP-binding protein